MSLIFILIATGDDTISLAHSFSLALALFKEWILFHWRHMRLFFFLIQLSIDGHWGCFHFLVAVDNWGPTLNSSGNISSSEIAGSYCHRGESIFSALLPQAAWETPRKIPRSHWRTFKLLRTFWCCSVQFYQEVAALGRGGRDPTSGQNTCSSPNMLT